MTGHSTSEQRERGGVVAWRIRTEANGGSEWAEAGSLEGSGGARSQARASPAMRSGTEREREKRRRRGVKGELAEGTGG